MIWHRSLLFYVFFFVSSFFTVPVFGAEQMMVRAFCQQVVAYQSSGDADYVPGIDIDGNAITPADLSTIEVPIVDPVDFNFEVDIADYFDLTGAFPEGSKVEPVLADLEIYQDGRILYNGQDISVPVLERCREDVDNGIEGEKIGDEAQSINGQGESNAVNSTSGANELTMPLPEEKPEPEIEVEVLEGQYP